MTDRALSHGSHATSPQEHTTEATSIHVSQNETINTFPTQDVPSQAPMPFNHANHHDTSPSHQQQLLDIELWKGEIQPPTMMPFFGGDSFSRLPFAIPDDFIQFIFNEKQFNSTTDVEHRPVSSLAK